MSSSTYDDPIPIIAYSCPESSGSSLLESIHKKRVAEASRSNESDLLKSIRAAFEGSGKEPGPPFRTTISPAIDGQDGEEELAWDDTTVVYSTGGTLRQSWNFEEEGQRIQYACFGWLLMEGTVHSGNAGTTRHSEDKDIPLPIPTEHKPERDTFGPFFHARKARSSSLPCPDPNRSIGRSHGSNSCGAL